jgi:hypothetical protein
MKLKTKDVDKLSLVRPIVPAAHGTYMVTTNCMYRYILSVPALPTTTNLFSIERERKELGVIGERLAYFLYE